MRYFQLCESVFSAGIDRTSSVLQNYDRSCSWHVLFCNLYEHRRFLAVPIILTSYKINYDAGILAFFLELCSSNRRWYEYGITTRWDARMTASILRRSLVTLPLILRHSSWISIFRFHNFQIRSIHAGEEIVTWPPPSHLLTHVMWTK